MVNMFDSILFGPTVPDPVAHAACSSDKVQWTNVYNCNCQLLWCVA